MSSHTALDKLECQDLIFRFGAALDRGAPDEAFALWLEDGTLIGPGGQTIAGITAIRQVTEAVPLNSFAPRLLTNVMVTLTGDNTATGFSYITLPRDLPKGEWHFEFRRTEDGWRISGQKVVAVVDHGAPAAPAGSEQSAG